VDIKAIPDEGIPVRNDYAIIDIAMNETAISRVRVFPAYMKIIMEIDITMPIP
jgi:D-ribose pyranose/furanose isomerase RbsD